MSSRQVRPPPIQENRVVTSLKDMGVPAPFVNKSQAGTMDCRFEFFLGDHTVLSFFVKQNKNWQEVPPAPQWNFYFYAFYLFNFIFLLSEK